MPINPIEITHDLSEAYKKYLKTIKSFQEDFWRSEFNRAISQEEFLLKGPIVEIAPPFKKGATIADLVEENILSSGFKRLCEKNKALPFLRPLYNHQEKAIKKIVSGRNVVISTGTGSGKTEGFLIPIIDYLLREQEAGTLSKPGVRALLLYPMNALANDQMKRLRRIFSKYPEITFGRYIGETEQDQKRAKETFKENYPEEPLLENELHSREEMQKTPPHILLTNYAMLEYLLLRPEDSSFFDGPTGNHWHFIVLDEVHVYDGANATEIAMLLRRLKYRVEHDNDSSIQAIATSATLGRGREDYPDVAEFASTLFEENFSWDESNPEAQDIVGATRVSLDSFGELWGESPPDIYHEMHHLIIIDQQNSTSSSDPDQAEVLQEILRKHGIPNVVINNAINFSKEFGHFDLQRLLFSIFQGDKRIRNILEMTQENPQYLSTIAHQAFPDDNNPTQALIELIDLAVMAKKGPNEPPILPAKYHIFARALEGAFVCLNIKAHKKDPNNYQPNLFLQRYKQCPHCRSRVFEIANCSRCGKLYLVGDEKSGRADECQLDGFEVKSMANYLVQTSVMSENIEATNTNYYVLTEDISLVNEDQMISDDSIDKEDIVKGTELLFLCPKCGEVYGEFGSPKCSCSAEPQKIYKVDIGRRRTLTRCVQCSTGSRSGVIYRFLTSQDAPVSVLATTLYQQIPPSHDEADRRKPGEGRKLLNFTDSRQKAAFFAPYIERIHQRNLRRRMIFGIINAENPPTNNAQHNLRELFYELYTKYDRLNLFNQEFKEDEKEEKSAAWVMKEFSPLDRRISLEGLGLICFRPKLPENLEVPEYFLNELGLNGKIEFEQLITTLANSLRYQGAITLLLDSKKDLMKCQRSEFEPRTSIYYIRKQESDRDKKILSWLPSANNRNARSDFLSRLLVQSQGVSDQNKTIRLLGEIWDFLKKTSWGNIFRKEEVKKLGIVYRINHENWIVEKPSDIFICDTCGNISAINLRGVCPVYNCQGKLESIDENDHSLKENLYRDLYQNMEPIPLRAQEHTAQWTPKAAAEVQNQFIHGDINLLSCSTTFELGVDVGDLQVVVLRNVPPTTANYIQRVGRAGRRTDSAAIALTFAQRRSHDITYYNHPESMVSGKIMPPTVKIQNEKIIRRHLHSHVFSAFFREVKDRKAFKTIEDFFAPEDGVFGHALLTEFLMKKPGEILTSLKRIIPASLHQRFGLDNWEWVSHLIQSEEESKALINYALLEVTSEIDEFAKLEDEAAKERQYKIADRFRQIINQIKGRNLLSYLGTHNILPKYGFPTDVVELKTNHLKISEAANVDLSRDLRIAISEFAPGGEIIAGKKVWHCAGVRLLPNKKLQPFHYAICKECQHFQYSTSEISGLECGHERMRQSTFIIPENGFVAGPDVDNPGESLPERTYASRVHFAEYRLPHNTEGSILPQDVKLKDLNNTNVQVQYSKYGWLAVINSGYSNQGFIICEACGFSTPNMFGQNYPRVHKNPFTGRDCRGSLIKYDLGHRFMTDVLEINLSSYMQSFPEMLSTLYAILEGASDALGVRRQDIDGTIKPGRKNAAPSLILYDDVPGGAGHVEKIGKNFRIVLEKAFEKVSECECGEETSCYNCLRNYRNQYFHNQLVRGIPMRVIGAILEE